MGGEIGAQSCDRLVKVSSIEGSHPEVAIKHFQRRSPFTRLLELLHCSGKIFLPGSDRSKVVVRLADKRGQRGGEFIQGLFAFRQGSRRLEPHLGQDFLSNQTS